VIEEKTGYETRVTVLGHVQRGGSPTAFDRILGTRYGVRGMQLVMEKKFGKMVSLRGNKIVAVELKEADSLYPFLFSSLYSFNNIF